MEDNNLDWKEIDVGLMILVIFVDDIIFEENDDESDKFAEEMKKEFKNEHNWRNEIFPGIVDCLDKEGIFISQTKY